MKANLKKLFLAVAVALPLMFTSCERKTDDVATITIAQPGNAVTEDANGNFTISGTISSPEGTRIDDIAVRLVHGSHTHLIADNSRGDDTFQGSGNRYLFSINQAHETLAETLDKVREESPELTSVVLRFTASVRNGGPPTEVNVTINFHQEVDPTTPLSVPTAFTWERVGAGTVQAMTQFGLSMITGGNADDGFTILVTAGTKLVRLDVADWTEITTREALAEKIDATPSAVHAGTNNRISFVRTTANVNHVFGVLHNDNYYMFNVTRTEINDAGAQNITRVIGNYKH